MKPSATHTVEPLEARIAPARLILVGAPNETPAGPYDVDYQDEDATNEAIFIDTEVAYDTDTRISQKVGKGLEGAPDTHYVRLSAGDLIALRTSTNLQKNLLQVHAGNVIAFFVDKDFNNEVGADELTGISLGKGARITVTGSVTGDIVTNLNENGTSATFDDTLDMTGLVSTKQSIGGVTVSGVVGGSIIAGGNIANIFAQGVDAILAGTAADGKTIDFFPGVFGGDGVLDIAAAPGQAGPSIQKVLLERLGSLPADNPDPLFTGRIHAGDGGLGAKGGSVSFIQVRQDATGMQIMAGDGGAAAPGKSGGAGGAISRIYIGGAVDPTADTVVISSGDGGNSTIGKGGAAGAVKDVFVGYTLFGGKPFPTSNLLRDNVEISGGIGGEGKVGGLGGSITNVDVRVDTAGGDGDEISVKGGIGGASVATGGKAGAGGNLQKIVVRNQDLANGAQYADILIEGGAAGATNVTGSSGGNGGNVTGITLLGWQSKVIGGSGSEGKVGGNGGSLTNIVLEENDAILPIGGQFDAGAGGKGTAGNGGKGGNIKTLLVEGSDLQSFYINKDSAGRGGDSVGGKGGAGGSVQSVEVRDGDVSNGATQTKDQPLTVRTGSGGHGTKGGGAGGLLKLFTLDSTNVHARIVTGSGGNVTADGKGKGGAGGSLETVSVVVRDVVETIVEGNVVTTATFGEVTSGAGGNGAGAGGAGGVGGSMKTVTVTADGAGFLHAGNGGSGQVSSGLIKGGASGAGGNIRVSQMKTLGGDGELIAGDAGVDGAKPGIGGSILGQNTEIRASLFARNDILIQAGKGSQGGAGGNIRFVGYGSSVGGVDVTPQGNIQIQAGNGGDSGGTLAGVGGSIFDVSGSLPSADPLQPGVGFTASITAGKGGAGASKSGAGGSVQNIVILGGGFDGAVLTVQAGDAGVSNGAATGGKGGSVKDVDVSPNKEFGMDSVFRSVAGGDGAKGTTKGGAGGNVESVYVDGLDIGDRNDVPYGFTSMGGIFAGVAGSGGSSPNGKVAHVVAKGIAAIVAGRGETPAPAEFVDDIILTDSNTLVRENNVFVQPGPFRLAFHADADVDVTTQGGAGVPEVQFVELLGLQLASVELVVGYAGESAVLPLPGNATAAQIEAALNALDSIKATAPGNTGAVTVTASATGFSITFNSEGDKPAEITVVATSKTGLFPASATQDDVETALNLLPTIKYLSEDHLSGSVIVNGPPGTFYVNYQEFGNLIPIDGIEAFSANLTELIQGAIVDEFATETTSGSLNIGVVEVQTGEQLLFVDEIVQGDVGQFEAQGVNLSPIANVPGGKIQFKFTGVFVTTEDAGGDNTTQEVQGFNTTAIKADATSTFTLRFGNGTTAPLPANATTAQVQTALNALGDIQAAGGVTVLANPNLAGGYQIRFNTPGARNAITGAVTSITPAPLLDATIVETDIAAELNRMAAVKVTAPDMIAGAVEVRRIAETNSYRIDFLQFGDQQLIEATAFANEVQSIDHQDLALNPGGQFTLSYSRIYQATEGQKGGGGLRERQDLRLGEVFASATSTYTLSFNGRTTGPLAGTATPAQIEFAIEDQLRVPIRSVVFAPGNVLQITFDTTGDIAQLFSATATSTTAPIDAAADATVVQTNLNALPTVKGPNGTDTVAVTSVPITGDFEVTFPTLGQRLPIVAGLIRSEVQNVDVAVLLDEATSSFRLGYGGEYTSDLLPTATAAEVQQALNALTSIQATGPNGTGGTVVVVPGAQPGAFDVTFTFGGDRLALDIHQEIDEIQDIDFAPGPLLTLTVDHDVTATVQVLGSTEFKEVQTLLLGAIRNGPEAQYTISFDPGDGVRTTAPLPGNANVQQIQDAINAAMAGVVGWPGVTVEDVEDVNGPTVQITFNIEGAQSDTFEVHATQSTAELSPTASATDIETALNALLTVQAKGETGSGGSVDVNLGTNTNFAVRFNVGGDQLPIQASQERSLQVAETRQGNAVIEEIQAFSTQAKGQPTDAAYAIANLIGFYSDHSELDANVFHFFRDGVRMTASAQVQFQLGDEPIDGLVMAKNLNMARISVTPEASWVATRTPQFYDWNNRISGPTSPVIL